MAGESNARALDSLGVLSDSPVATGVVRSTCSLAAGVLAPLLRAALAVCRRTRRRLAAGAGSGGTATASLSCCGLLSDSSEGVLRPRRMTALFVWACISVVTSAQGKKPARAAERASAVTAAKISLMQLIAWRAGCQHLPGVWSGVLAGASEALWPRSPCQPGAASRCCTLGSTRCPLGSQTAPRRRCGRPDRTLQGRSTLVRAAEHLAAAVQAAGQ